MLRQHKTRATTGAATTANESEMPELSQPTTATTSVEGVQIKFDSHDDNNNSNNMASYSGDRVSNSKVNSQHGSSGGPTSSSLDALLDSSDVQILKTKSTTGYFAALLSGAQGEQFYNYYQSEVDRYVSLLWLWLSLSWAHPMHKSTRVGE